MLDIGLSDYYMVVMILDKTANEIVERAEDSRLVILGEKHVSTPTRFLETLVAEKLAKKGFNILALEYDMDPVSFQNAIDQNNNPNFYVYEFRDESKYYAYHNVIKLPKSYSAYKKMNNYQRQKDFNVFSIMHSGASLHQMLKLNQKYGYSLEQIDCDIRDIAYNNKLAPFVLDGFKELDGVDKLLEVDDPNKTDFGIAVRNNFMAYKLNEMMNDNSESKILLIDGANHNLSHASNKGVVPSVKTVLQEFYQTSAKITDFNISHTVFDVIYNIGWVDGYTKIDTIEHLFETNEVQFSKMKTETMQSQYLPNWDVVLPEKIIKVLDEFFNTIPKDGRRMPPSNDIAQWQMLCLEEGRPDMAMKVLPGYNNI